MNQSSFLYMLYLPFLLWGGSLACQDVERFKDSMSPEKYNELLQLEKEAREEEDQYQKALTYKMLGDRSTIINNQLGANFYRKAMEEGLKANSDSLLAEIQMFYAIPELNIGRLDKARDLIESSMEYWLSTADTLRLALCYGHRAYLERLEGSYYSAIRSDLKSKELKSNLMPIHEMPGTTNALIQNYIAIGDRETAISVAEEYLQSARDIKPKPSGYYLILRNTGQLRLEEGSIDIAKEYINEAMPYRMRSKHPKILAWAYDLKSMLAMKEGDFKMAYIFADSSLHFAELHDAPQMISQAHLKCYRTLKAMNKYDQLQYHMDRAISTAFESKQNDAILSATEQGYVHEADKGNYKKAFELLRVKDSLSNEIYSTEEANSIKKLEKRLVEERSQEEINLLNIQNDLKSQNLEKASRLRKSLIGILVLVAGVAILIFMLLRQRTKNNDLLQHKNRVISHALEEKETLLREIHHRVKNNLQFISSLLGLQTEHVQDEAALGVLQEGQDRVQSMALIHQNLYQEDNLTGVDMQDYFQKLVQGLFDSYNIHDDNIQLKLEIEDVSLDVDTVIPIGLIVNELITNSLKYAFPDNRAGMISIFLCEENEQLALEVSDNGIGMSDAESKELGESFGYRLVEAFTEQLEADMSIDNTNGTSIRFIIHSYKVAV